MVTPEKYRRKNAPPAANAGRAVNEQLIGNQRLGISLDGVNGRSAQIGTHKGSEHDGGFGKVQTKKKATPAHSSSAQAWPGLVIADRPVSA